MKTIFITISILVLLSNPIIGYAESGKPISVGVLDFDATESGIDKLGPKIANMITAYLSTNQGLKMVERAEINKVLGELCLSKTGIVDEKEAVQIGHVVGAEILVTGRAFLIDDELVIVSKIIGTETTRVFGNVVKGPLSDKPTTLIEEIATRITKTIEDQKNELLPTLQPEKDIIAILRKKVQGKKLPRVSVDIQEKHIGERDIDSPAEKEMVFILRKCGFEVIRDTENPPGSKARSRPKEADILLVGEAFSELGARTGSLISIKAWVEIRAVDTSNNRVLASSRKTATAVDLSERIAARTALQNATIDTASNLIPEMLDSWQR